MMNLTTIIAVASGGAIGATLRLITTQTIHKTFIHSFPLGTLMVNLLGSFLIGMFFAYFHTNNTFSPFLKTFIISGILGALTTYSAFAIESFLLLEHGQYGQALINITLNVFGTIFFAGLGYFLMIQKYN